MKRWRKIRERAIEYFLMLNGLLAVGILLAILFLLLKESLPAFREMPFIRTLGGTRWNPSGYTQPGYGILGMVVSTMMVTLGALLLAAPAGLACAVYIAELASPRIRELSKPIVESLAGIPSVVVGFLGIVLVGPVVARLFGLTHGLNALNGAVLLAVMSLPTIVSISEDALRAVPGEYKDASLALGATQWQTLWRVTVPAAGSGIIASFMLGMGRAIGETMTVLMATGNATAIPHTLLDPVRTMTATIAIELGEVPYGTLHYHALFVVGFILFVMTFVVNLMADLILQRFQQVRR
ncbi:MAG: phosphate ABC transporter permease subunit PstC [Candidatus Tectomicrobia bacterium]|uniref:Phosphate transport system permease protein n=1 Tax=Tectimicrobiota bacterium TaxID=2528274 RepID=A0A932CR45_UNCTE|nr:phosphate ABC transporter permease subunit PstC [Candidatus Tectomicrobia bacterium]